MEAQTLDQIRERDAYNRGFVACKRAALEICNDEGAVAQKHQNTFRDGMAHGAERCGNRISRLGTPQEHDQGVNNV